MSSNRAPTLQDVALAAGVSSATVSRHRRGLRRFPAELAARIDAAADSLGYREHAAARSLATGRSGTVGLVVLDLANPHFTGLVQGAQVVALQQGYGVAFVDTAESAVPERQSIEALARRVDGLVLSARLVHGNQPTSDAAEWIRRLGKPVVFYGRLGLAGWHSVGTDGAAAAALLGAHLAALGHRRVCYLDFEGSRWSGERRRGLQQALARSGARLSVQALSAPDAQAAEAVAARVLMVPPARRPTAVAAYNDLSAVGFISEARRLGIAVPQQVSVAGFDDIELARHVQPALTTVAMHNRLQGEIAMQRLLQAMAGTLAAPHDETLTPRLIVRASTTPPGAPP